MNFHENPALPTHLSIVYSRFHTLVVELISCDRDCCCCCCSVASVVSDSARPHRRQPPGSAVPGILQARTLEWVAIAFSNAWKWKVKVKSLSRSRPSATPWTAACQAPPSMGLSRQEYWSGVPSPSPLEMLVYNYCHLSFKWYNWHHENWTQKIFLLFFSL